MGLIGLQIDLVFVVVSAHDRVDVGNTMIAVALPFFFNSFDLRRCWLVMTHCDQVEDLTKEYIDAWKDELESCAKGKLCKSVARFDKTRAAKGELGMLGKKPHADELRCDVLSVVREHRTYTHTAKSEGVAEKAVFKDPEGMWDKLYVKLVDVFDPDT